MVDIRDCAIAICFLEGYDEGKCAKEIFQENDRNLFYDWFMKEWNDAWDQEVVESHIKIIGDKIKELKGI